MLIEQLAIHMHSNTINVGVWHKPGVADLSTSGLVQVFDATVTGQGQGVPTLLPPFSSPVDIPPNSSHTFYTTGTDEPVSIYYTDGSSLHSTFVSDSYISILEGYSVRFPYRSEQYPTQFNGKVGNYYCVLITPLVANFFPCPCRRSCRDCLLLSGCTTTQSASNSISDSSNAWAYDQSDR